jgi:hypothetical protein
MDYEYTTDEEGRLVSVKPLEDLSDEEQAKILTANEVTA